MSWTWAFAWVSKPQLFRCCVFCFHGRPFTIHHSQKTHRSRQRQGSSQRGSGCLARLASLGSLGYSVVIYKKHSIEPDSGMEIGKGEAGAGRLSGCWSGVEPKLRHTCSCGRGARGRKGEGRIGREGRGTGGREEEPGEGERRGRGRLSIEK